MLKIHLVILALLLTCSGCSMYISSKLGNACDLPNVYCGKDGSEESEREFKRSATSAALANDIANFGEFIAYIFEPRKTVGKVELDNSPPPKCDDSEKLICSANNGCYCEPLE